MTNPGSVSFGLILEASAGPCQSETSIRASETTAELAAKPLRLAWGIWQSGRPYEPARGARPTEGRPA